MKQSEGNTDLQKVCALSEGMYNLASSVWHGGSPHQPYSKCKTATTNFDKKLTKSGNISRAELLQAEVRRRAPLNRAGSLFELFSLVFTSKDMKGGAKSRTASPQFLSLESPLSAASRVLSRNNQDYSQSLTIKVSPSPPLMLPFHCCVSLSSSVIKP